MTIATPDEWEAKCDEMAEKLRKPKHDSSMIELHREGDNFYGSFNGDTICVDSRNRIEFSHAESAYYVAMPSEVLGFHGEFYDLSDGHFCCVVLNRLHPRVAKHLNSGNHAALADLCVWIKYADSDALDLASGWLSRS